MTLSQVAAVFLGRFLGGWMFPNNAVAILRQDFQERKKKNPRFSLRGYALFLDVPSGRLSEILSGKRDLTQKQLSKICKKLPKNSDLRRALSKLMTAENETVMILEDEFRSISDGIHSAILSLLETNDFVFDLDWIGRRLGKSSSEIDSAIKRLLRLQLVRVANSGLEPCQGGVQTTTDIPSAALKLSHRATLQQAIEAINSVPLELRDLSSITLAIDVKKIPAAKKRIQKFRMDMMQFLESGAKNEVYNLNIQLLPVTKVTKISYK